MFVLHCVSHSSDEYNMGIGSTNVVQVPVAFYCPYDTLYTTGHPICSICFRHFGNRLLFKFCDGCRSSRPPVKTTCKKCKHEFPFRRKWKKT
jgi:hypothetical protein